jgi:hypothetical protein
MGDRQGRELNAGDAVVWQGDERQDAPFTATATVMDVLGDNRYRIELDLELEPSEEEDQVSIRDQLEAQLAEAGIEAPAQLPDELRARVSAEGRGDALRAEVAELLFAVYTEEEPLEVEGRALTYLDESGS